MFQRIKEYLASKDSDLVMLLIIFLVIILLTGCTTVKEVPVSIETKVNNKLILPTDLTTKCIIPIPPDRKDYAGYNYTAKENVLINYSNSLLIELANCSKRLEGVKEYVNKYNTIIN